MRGNRDTATARKLIRVGSNSNLVKVGAAEKITAEAADKLAAAVFEAAAAGGAVNAVML